MASARGLKELKEEMFGGFTNWLERNNIRDTFSQDVWGYMVLSKLYEQYSEWAKEANGVSQFLAQITPAELRKFADDKEAQTAKDPLKVVEK